MGSRQIKAVGSREVLRYCLLPICLLPHPWLSPEAVAPPAVSEGAPSVCQKICTRIEGSPISTAPVDTYRNGLEKVPAMAWN